MYINAQFGLAQPITSVNCSQKGVIPCADADSIYLYIRGPGWLVGKSAGLVIERLRVRIPAEAAGEFSSPEFTLRADSYSVSVPTPAWPQWHAKDLGHSAKSASGRLHLNTHAPWIQRSRTGLTMPLSRQSVDTYPETSSHATCHEAFEHSRLSSLNHCRHTLRTECNQCARTNLHFKKKKSVGGEWMVEHSSKILASNEKATVHIIRTCSWKDDREFWKQFLKKDVLRPVFVTLLAPNFHTILKI